MRLVYLWRKFSCKAHLQTQPQWKGCAPALPIQRGSSSLASTSPIVFDADKASRHLEGAFWWSLVPNRTPVFSCLNPIYFKTSHYVFDHYNLFKQSDSLKYQCLKLRGEGIAPHISPPSMLCMAWPPAPSSPTSQSIPGPAVQVSCDGSQEKEKRWEKKNLFCAAQKAAKHCKAVYPHFQLSGLYPASLTLGALCSDARASQNQIPF